MAYIPLIGGALDASFPLQFPQSKVSFASLSTTPVEQLSDDGLNALIAHGTGFFWKHKSVVYLITARHVLSGLNPFTGLALAASGYLPNRIRTFPCVQTGPNTWTRSELELPLTGDNGERVWLEDREFIDLRTDIAAISIPDSNFNVRCLNESQDIHTDMMSMAGFECVVLGYPTPHTAGLRTPVWRRGSFASEPLLPVDDKPMFLLDASTSPGFSGAPVIRRHLGPLPVNESDGSITANLSNIQAMCFVGVYAGRLQHPHVGGEVPFVFYANRLNYILP